MDKIIAYLDKKYPNINVLTKEQLQKEILTKDIPKKLDRKYIPKKEIALFIKNMSLWLLYMKSTPPRYLNNSYKYLN